MTRSRTFAADLSSIRSARAFVSDQLIGWTPQEAEAAVLLVSELVTNSIRHAQTWFRVTVDLTPDVLRVEVSDQGDGQPVLRNPSPSEPTGRGLQIVEALAQRWGIQQDGETLVWFELDRGRGATGRDAEVDDVRDLPTGAAEERAVGGARPGELRADLSLPA